MQNLTARVEPVTLTGRYVRLEPLTLAHTAGLTKACGYAEIWRYLRAELRDENDVEAWIAAALEEQRKRNELPFAIIDLQSGQPVGSTRYFTIAQKDRGLAIGSTWLTPSAWRTPNKLGSQVSTSAKRVREPGLHTGPIHYRQSQRTLTSCDRTARSDA